MNIHRTLAAKFGLGALIGPDWRCAANILTFVYRQRCWCKNRDNPVAACRMVLRTGTMESCAEALKPCVLRTPTTLAIPSTTRLLCST